MVPILFRSLNIRAGPGAGTGDNKPTAGAP